MGKKGPDVEPEGDIFRIKKAKRSADRTVVELPFQVQSPGEGEFVESEYLAKGELEMHWGGEER